MPGGGGPQGPRLSWRSVSWRSDELETRCGRESPHPAEWAPGPPVEHQENENDTWLCPEGVGEVNILQSLFGLQLPLTRKPYNKVRDIFF